MVLGAACGTRNVHLWGLERIVRDRIASGDATPIALTEATTFSWDRVYIFPPYTDRQSILASIRTKWDDIDRTGIEMRDDAVLIVFMRAGRVAAFAMFPRGAGDLGHIQATHGLAPEEARFVARWRTYTTGERRVILELAEDGGEKTPGK